MPMSLLKDTYNTSVHPTLAKEFSISNKFAVPAFVKVVVNIGVGEAIANKKAIASAQQDLEKIVGQRAVVTKARNSVAAFKVRKGYPIGVKSTLRGKRMYSFLEKLIYIVIPRLRDFRGISHNSVDQHGNLNLGFSEQTLFPEIEYDKIDKIRGLEVTIVTSTRNREAGKKLFELIGIPFTKV